MTIIEAIRTYLSDCPMPVSYTHLDVYKRQVKTNDHCQDALRYFVMGAWQYIRQMLPMITEED